MEIGFKRFTDFCKLCIECSRSFIGSKREVHLLPVQCTVSYRHDVYSDSLYYLGGAVCLQAVQC